MVVVVAVAPCHQGNVKRNAKSMMIISGQRGTKDNKIRPLVVKKATENKTHRQNEGGMIILTYQVVIEPYKCARAPQHSLLTRVPSQH